MEWLTQLWYPKKKRSLFLLPFVGLVGCYRFVIFFRKCMYRFGIKHQQRFSVPVIVVGNISVGGTGKTPLVAWLAHFLQKEGYHPGIVSRGYRSKKTRRPQTVTEKSQAFEVGDEPLMLKQQTGCPVVVFSKRVQAVKKLLANESCDIIISDDGLQHYALARNIEIAVIDGTRRLGNGFCLPIGPLREPKRRLETVDFIVCNGGAPKNNEFSMQIMPQKFRSICDANHTICVSKLSSRSIVAIAAIEHPERFFNLLTDMGLKFKKHIFRDHYRYQKYDFDFLGPEDIVVMTEKDAVKCRSFCDHRFYYLSIHAVLTKEFSVELLRKLESLRTCRSLSGAYFFKM